MNESQELQLRRQLKAAVEAKDERAELAARRALAPGRQEAPAWEATRPDRLSTRIGKGVVEAGLGVAQIMSRPVGAVGRAVGSEYLARSPEAVDETVRQLLASQESGAPEGFDAGRLVGNVAAFGPAIAARAPAALTRVIQAGTPVARAMKAGAAAGGGGAAVMPTTSDNFALGKAGQIAGGTAGGAILGPIASKAGDLIGRAAQRGWSAVTGTVRQSVDDVLRANGLNPAAAGAELNREIAAQIQAARATGGAVNQEAIANAQAADRLGVRQLMTRGQIERSPDQFGREEFLRNTGVGDLAENFNTVQARLQRGLGELQDGAAPALDNAAAGARVAAPLERIASARQQQVGRAYDAATNAVGRDAQVNAARVANDVYAQIEQEVSAPLPGHIATALNRFSSGELPMDVTRAQQLIKAINKSWSGADEATRHSLGILKSRLDGALAETGAEAAYAFRAARALAARNFRLQERVPALKAMVDESIPPDQLVQKFVLGSGKEASRENVVQLRRVLNATDPGAWQQVRGQVVDSLRTAAGFSENASQAKFNPVAFDKALRSLRQGGKMGVVFDSREVQMLNDIARIGRAIGERPAAVSGTGLAGAARLAGMFGRLMERIGSAPGVSQTIGAASAVIAPAVRGVQARTALGAPRFAAPGQPGPTPIRNALAAGAGVSGPLLNQ